MIVWVLQCQNRIVGKKAMWLTKLKPYITLLFIEKEFANFRCKRLQQVRPKVQEQSEDSIIILTQKLSNDPEPLVFCQPCWTKYLYTEIHLDKRIGQHFFPLGTKGYPAFSSI